MSTRYQAVQGPAPGYETASPPTVLGPWRETAEEALADIPSGARWAYVRAASNWRELPNE